MVVSLFLEIFPGLWPQNSAAEKMLRHKILWPRTSLATKDRDLVAEKVLVHKFLVSEKMLKSKFLVFEVILNNNILCPSMSSGTILMQTVAKQQQQHPCSRSCLDLPPGSTYLNTVYTSYICNYELK